MKRRDDWQEQLARVVRNWQHEPWIWGSTDCAHFMAACVAAITGVDPIAKIRGTYDSRLSCMARIRRHGFASVEAMAAATFDQIGWPEGIPACSQIGDVGVTADNVLCVRLACGFVARTEASQYAIVTPVRSWCIAWEGA